MRAVAIRRRQGRRRVPLCIDGNEKRAASAGARFRGHARAAPRHQVADASNIFDTSFTCRDLVECGCNMQGRRYFVKALDAGDTRAALLRSPTSAEPDFARSSPEASARSATASSIVALAAPATRPAIALNFASSAQTEIARLVAQHPRPSSQGRPGPSAWNAPWASPLRPHGPCATWYLRTHA